MVTPRHAGSRPRHAGEGRYLTPHTSHPAPHTQHLLPSLAKATDNRFICLDFTPLKMKVKILFLLLVASTATLNAQTHISDYRSYLATANLKGQTFILLRSFKADGKASYLAVNPQNLNTQKIFATELRNLKPCSFSQLTLKMGNTPYIKALLRAQANALPMQDAGITHALPQEKGITLTIDLCPSHKGLDRDIFTSLIGAFKEAEKPIPVALSLTGKFLKLHQGDIDWLKSLVKSGNIDITWINHTYNHRYDPKIPISHNFLLEPGTDLQQEVLMLESAMFEQNLMPSVFFRFPGLVSSQQLVNKVGSFGLIPVGSDAWLAKGQQALPGSLVLIHGNGNEPLGVKDFIKLLGTEASQVRKKQWLLYDLRAAAE